MNSIFVSMNIHFLTAFFKHIEEGVSRELEKLESKCENGEIKEYEDYESLLDYPLFRAEFGAKSICYELNAMVESQLHDKATPHFLIEKNENGKYKRKGSASELGFFEPSSIFMQKLPIFPASEAQRTPILKRVQNILENTDSPEISRLESEIDELIYELYDLTPGEIEIVKGE